MARAPLNAPEVVAAREAQTRADDVIGQIRSRLVDFFLTGMAVLTVVAAPVSAWRSVYTGWLPLYSFHLALMVVTVGVWGLRRRIAAPVKVGYLLCTVFLLSFVALVNFGAAASGGLALLLLGNLLAAVFFSRRYLNWVIGLSLLGLGTIGVLFLTGVLTLGFDANRAAVAVQSWITVLVAAVVCLVFFVHAFGAYQGAVYSLLAELRAQRDQIARMAEQDQLTGLPALRLAHDRLEMACHQGRRYQHKVALLFIDLDGFKAVNDGFGHEAGDLVLMTVAQRLRSAIRAEDTAARIGGDEFVVVLNSISNEDDAAALAGLLIQRVNEAIDYHGTPLVVGASIGIAVFPEHGGDAQTLRRRADQAMYSVKRAGKNHFAFHG